MRKKTSYIISFAMAVLAAVMAMQGCGGSPTPAQETAAPVDTMPVMLGRLQQCSRLNTVELKVRKIITHDDMTRLSGTVFGKSVSVNLPTGKRKVAIPMYATIKGSIDLSKLTKDDIVRNGDNIEVFLPQPEAVITETHIDHDGIKQYVALTRSRFSDEELLSYEKQGRTAIERDIPNMNIRELSRESAARQMIPIIEAMGFKEKNIIISFRDNGKHNTILRKNE